MGALPGKTKKRKKIWSKKIKKRSGGLTRASKQEAKTCCCIADDVQWQVAGAFTAIGKEEFRKNIRNDAFTGDPVIATINEIGEGNQVAVEGEVKAMLKDGTPWSAWFHNTYTLFNGRITKMTSYLVQKP
ncbi:MAG: nuclear transport factor 2 family protein [Bacteroidia bacterium]